jgi:type IX secretion system PorP/SprF family membrane protein
MKKLFLIVFLSITGFAVSAQEYVYTLNQFAPLIYHPSYAAIDNDASIAFVNRRTQIASGINYQNNIFHGEYPMIERKSGKRYGGIGFHVLQKDAGNTDLLQSYAIGLSVAYNLQIQKDQFVSFGLQSNYYNKRTSLSNLTTGSQWLASEFRFDPEADMGETITQNRISYFGVNAGLLWYLRDHKSGAQKAFAGFTAFNMNKPGDSFIEGDSRVPIGYQFTVGALVYHTKRMHLTPQIVYQRDNNNNVVNLLLSNKILFENENPYDILQSGSIELLGKFDLKKDLSLGIALNQPGVSIGFSYNFSLASDAESQYFRNGTEFGIKLSKTIWKPRPAKVMIENTSIGVKRDFNFSTPEKQGAVPAAEQKSDVDIIQKNIEDLAKVKAVQFHLEKNFHFGFGKADLDSEAKVYLDELYQLLQKNREYNLEVIGHTDNVGKHLVNYKLSTARAKAVVDYLKQLGLEEERVKFSGRGDTQPKGLNNTEEDRSKNRRVEFLIYVDR